MSGCGIKNTVTIVTHRHRSFGGVQGDLFKGQPCWGGNRSCRGKAPAQRQYSMYRLCASSLGERKQHLLIAAGCQKCFCVTLDKSNRTPAAAGGVKGSEIL